ncbi:PPE domain-containing protein, partial [Lentzea sp.]|uniref:PPE domain-containing protein n=1 Tax=Lentzea sp. TaxID=56099 RepID=UPI002ED4C3D1
MSGYRQLTDWNFDGWSNQDLAAEVQKLNSSTVTAEFSEASAALRDLAGKLDAADSAVQAELRRLSIHWGGSAAEKGQSQTKVVADDLNDGSQASQQNSKAITQQGESTSTARYSTPPSQDLRGDTEQNFGDKVAGFVGIETDHAAEVEATNRARQQAIDSLNGYVSGSQGSLDGFRAPNQPADMVVSSAAVTPSMSSSVGQPQVGAPGVPGGPGFTGLPGSPGAPGVPLGATPGIT